MHLKMHLYFIFEIELNPTPHRGTGEINPLPHGGSGRYGPPYQEIMFCMLKINHHLRYHYCQAQSQSQFNWTEIAL